MTPSEKFYARRGDAQRRYYDELDNIRKAELMFERYKEMFEKYPIVIVDEHDEQTLNTYNVSIHDYIRERCREKEWMHIRISQTYRGYEMIVPNNHKSQKLIAGLLMLAGQVSNLKVDTKSRTWTFMFREEQGKEILDKWIEQCKIDILYQLALNFGPAVNPSIKPLVKSSTQSGDIS